MDNEKIDKLNKLLEILKDDTVKPSDIESFLVLVLDVIKKSKENFETLSTENLNKITDFLSYIEREHSNVLALVSQETSNSKNEIDSKIKEVNTLLEEVKNQKNIIPQDGKDADETKIVEEVLSKIEFPTYEVFTLEEKGTDIVAEINALPIDNDDYKIDYVHIKNVPDFSSFTRPNGGGWRNLFQMHDVVITSPTNNQVLKYDSTLGAWVNSNGSGITVTLADVSADSTNTTTSTYTMTSGVPVNFKTSDTNSLLYLDDTHKTVGIRKTSSLLALSVQGTNAGASSSGSSENGAIRVLGAGTNAILDIGIVGSGAHSWLQVRDSSNYATTYNLALQPTGGGVMIGTVSRVGGNRLTVVNSSAPGAGFFASSSSVVNINSISDSTQIVMSTGAGSGTVRGYAGADSTYAFKVWNSTASTVLFNVNNSTGDTTVKGLILNTTSADGLMQIVSAGTARSYIGADASNRFIVYDNTASNAYLKVANTGAITLANLAGTGTRMVTADSTGLLATDTLPVGTNYTPTATNVTNVSSSTPNNATYTRVGNVVSVDGTIDVTVTAAVATEVDVSLPIASNLANATDLNGQGYGLTTLGDSLGVYITGDTTNDRAQIKFTGLTVGGVQTIYYHFSYKIL